MSIEPTDDPAGQPDGDPQQPPVQVNIGRSSAIMGLGTLASRILGMVKGSLVAGIVGTTVIAADAFDTANTLPNQLYVLLAGGMLNAVLVPQVAKAARHKDGGADYLNRLLTLSILILASATLVVTLAAGLLVRVFVTSNWPAEAITLATAFAYICLPQVFFYGLYTLIGQVLNARGQFGAYMWAPALANVVNIAGLVVFLELGWPTAAPVSAWTGGMIWLVAGSATLGITVQALFLIIPLRRGGFRYTPTFGFRGVGLRSASTVAMWTFAALVLSQLRFIPVARVLTEALNRARIESVIAGGKAAYGYAFTIFMLPHSLVTVSLVTALFTRMAHAAQANRTSEIVADVARGMRVPAVILIPATIGGALLSPWITRAIFFKSSPQDTRQIALITAALLVGLLPLSWNYLQSRVFYAFEDARTPFNLQVIISVIGAIGPLLALLAATPDIAWLVALSQSVANVVAGVVGFVWLRRKLGPLGMPAIVQQHVRVLTASLAAVLPTWLALRVLPGYAGSFGGALVTLSVAGSLYLAITLWVADRLRVSEVGELLSPLRHRFPGR